MIICFCSNKQFNYWYIYIYIYLYYNLLKNVTNIENRKCPEAVHRNTHIVSIFTPFIYFRVIASTIMSHSIVRKIRIFNFVRNCIRHFIYDVTVASVIQTRCNYQLNMRFCIIWSVIQTFWPIVLWYSIY